MKGLQMKSNSAMDEPVKVGARPRDVVFGRGAVWVVNQFDGTLSRVGAR